MKRFIFALALPLAFASSGCGQMTLAKGAGDAAYVADAVGAPAPVKLADGTTIDERLLTVSAKTVDALALSVTALVHSGVVKAGSPTAMSLATGLDDARVGLNAAMAATSATSYSAALFTVEAAVAQIKVSLHIGT